jgi:hypothetical protein
VRSYVFISSSPEETGYLERLTAHLTRAGIGYHTGIAHHADRPSATEERIRACAAMVVLATPRSQESDQVRAEVKIAQAEQRPLVPLLVAAGDLMPELAGVDVTDVTDGQMPPDAFTDRLRWLSTARPTGAGAFAAEPMTPRVPGPRSMRIATGLCFVGAVAGLVALLDSSRRHGDAAATILFATIIFTVAQLTASFLRILARRRHEIGLRTVLLQVGLGFITFVCLYASLELLR